MKWALAAWLIVAAACSSGGGAPTAYELGEPPAGYILCVVSGPVEERELLFQLTYEPVEGQGGVTLFGLDNDGPLLGGAEGERVVVRGRDGIERSAGGGPNVIAWRERDGVELRLVSFTLDLGELAAIAESIEPVESLRADSSSCA